MSTVMLTAIGIMLAAIPAALVVVYAPSPTRADALAQHYASFDRTNAETVNRMMQGLR